MKKLICVLLTLVVCLSMAACSSGSGSNASYGENGLAYTKNSDKISYTLSGIGKCTDTDIVIPSVFEGKTVTIIADGAFRDCTQLTSVTIPAGITEIGESAFEGCTSLTFIYYNGTIAAWNNIFKAAKWNQSVDCTVRCTNGDIAKK